MCSDVEVNVSESCIKQPERGRRSATELRARGRGQKGRKHITAQHGFGPTSLLARTKGGSDCIELLLIAVAAFVPWELQEAHNARCILRDW